MTLSDHQQLETLFERHYAAVLAYALRRGDRSLAEDVVSETFAVAWRRRADIPADPLPWLYGVARRVLANERRAGIRRERLAVRLHSDAQAPSVAPVAASASGELLEAISRLPDHEREALMLVAWEELSPAQAAIAAGCTRVALRARLYRARRRLVEWVPELAGGPTAIGERGASFEASPGGCGPITDRSRS